MFLSSVLYDKLNQLGFEVGVNLWLYVLDLQYAITYYSNSEKRF